MEKKNTTYGNSRSLDDYWGHSGDGDCVEIIFEDNISNTIAAPFDEDKNSMFWYDYMMSQQYQD
jgi:hypothetical protein